MESSAKGLKEHFVPSVVSAGPLDGIRVLNTRPPHQPGEKSQATPRSPELGEDLPLSVLMDQRDFTGAFSEEILKAHILNEF